MVTIDKEKAVLENPSESSKQLPSFNIIYPDLNITSVQVPTSGSYRTPMTFIASVGNESLATIFTPFTVGFIPEPMWKAVPKLTWIKTGDR